MKQHEKKQPQMPQKVVIEKMGDNSTVDRVALRNKLVNNLNEFMKNWNSGEK